MSNLTNLPSNTPIAANAEIITSMPVLTFLLVFRIKKYLQAEIEIHILLEGLKNTNHSE
jgi:hypothetical protein